MKTPIPVRHPMNLSGQASIKRNRYGNWRGYVGRAMVWEIGASQWDADLWLREQEAVQAGAALGPVTVERTSRDFGSGWEATGTHGTMRVDRKGCINYVSSGLSTFRRPADLVYVGHLARAIEAYAARSGIELLVHDRLTDEP